MDNVKELYESKIEFAENMYDATDRKDVLLIMTEWQVFRTPDFNQLQERMNANVIFDGRNLFDLDYMAELGFYYSSIGRRVVH